MKSVDYYALLIIIIFSLCNEARGDVTPYGFEEYFKLTDTAVKVRNLDGSFSEEITFLMKYDELILDVGNKSSINSLIHYLDNNHVSKEYWDEILSFLMAGVREGNECLGELKTCKVYPETFSFLSNYNDKELYFFVNPKILSNEYSNYEKKYHEPKSKSNGVINSFDFYFNSYKGQGTSISANNKTIVGLPYGYFINDLSLRSDDGLDIYETSYQLDFDAYVFKAGSSQYEAALNSTDFMSSSYRVPQEYLSFGSSSKLLLGGVSSSKSVTIYSPGSGQVEVYRDDRIILQRSVSEGYNYINYNDLPSGRYEIIAKILNSGKVVSIQSFPIYNGNDDNLNPGEFDFKLSIGRLKESYFDYPNNNQLSGQFFVNGAVAYKPISSLTIGAAGSFYSNNHSLTVGAKYFWLDKELSSEFIYSFFNNRSDYFRTNLSLKNINLSYESLNNNRNDPLANYLYGYTDYSRLSMTGVYNFGAGRSIYATYNLNDDKEITQQFIGRNRRYQSFSLGYSAPSYFNSTLSINADFESYYNNLSIGLMWSVPLSANLDFKGGLTTYNDRLTQLKSSLRSDNVLRNNFVNNSLEISNTYDRYRDLAYQEAIFNASANTEYANLSMNSFLSSNKNGGVSFGASSTQVITGEDFYITSRAARSYTAINVVEGDDFENQNDEKGHFALKRNGIENGSLAINRKKTLVPLNEYSSYEANFNSESVDLYNNGDKYISFYSHPGTVTTIKPEISRIVSFVSAFNDINEHPVSNVTCEGGGCLSSSEISHGVHRVTVLEGLPFVLRSQSGVCLIPYNFSNTSHMNFGKNYCLPLSDSDKSLKTVEIDGKKQKIYFLGAFSNDKMFVHIKRKINEIGYNLVVRKVGELNAFYLAQEPEKFDELFDLNLGLIVSFERLSKKNYKVSSVSYSMANNLR
ncbi:TcfC E-set like domain-containing protein [Shewanella algae]|uniref:TcfC E-set like domain-containing protein n=1 Tax=Shewanella algae TaxID=38313 RepID=UPI002358E6B7|nr:TcfC E-set like domain-containing protein [Shewanella algae]MDC8855806.1 TcfC E-set like domain-containing protein [Shewanella algae]